jgi:NADPH:quinone reductase-like Zn-dependent oxidoreductase
MKAIVCTEYGSPDVLHLREVAKPTPKADEVLIKIHAATVTPSDCAFRKGEPFIIKLMYGLNRPRLSTQGVEFAGEVETTGGAVKRFRPGDAVFGLSVDRFGAHAEYLCLPETKPIVHKPANQSYAAIVGICDGAATALIFLRDVAKLQPGQNVLINGASGAVGVYGVQLAKHYGTQVTAVCSAKNFALVQALGADHTIDYTQEDFTRRGVRYDVIFDAVGKCSFAECKVALTPTGLYLTTVPTLGIVWQMAQTAFFGSKKAKFVTAGLMQNQANLTHLAELAAAGQLKAVLDRCYPLEQIAAAHRYVEEGHKKGNVIINVPG